MLNIVLRTGIAKITNTSAADINTAPISLLLLNTFVLNSDFLLSLTLNTCTNSDRASVANAIVCPTSIFDSSKVSPSIGSFVVANPITKATRVRSPIIAPW